MEPDGADWRRLITASPQGCFVATTQDSVVGTVTTITYAGRVSWVGMVLVDPQHRGQGILNKLSYLSPRLGVEKRPAQGKRGTAEAVP